MFLPIVAMIIVGCQKGTGGGAEDDPQEETVAQTEITTLYSPSSQGDVEMIIQSGNFSDIAISIVGENVDWVKYVGVQSQQNVAAKSEIGTISSYVATFQFEENTSSSSRSAVIKYSRSDSSKEFTVTQAAANSEAGLVINAASPDLEALSTSNVWLIESGTDEEIYNLLSNMSANQLIRVSAKSYNGEIPSSNSLSHFHSGTMNVLSTRKIGYCPNLVELSLPAVSEISEEFSLEYTPNLQKLIIATTSTSLVADVYSQQTPEDNMNRGFERLDVIIGTDNLANSGVFIDGATITVPVKNPNEDLEHYLYGPFKSVNGSEQAKMEGPFYFSTLPYTIDLIGTDTIVILDKEVSLTGSNKLKDIIYAHNSENLEGSDRRFHLVFPNVEQIMEEDALTYLNNVKSISAPKLTYIGLRVFQGNYDLEEINIPQVTFIDNSAFAECTNLKKLYLPKVEYLEDYVFSGCSSLDSLVIATEVTSFRASSNSLYGLDYSKITLKTSENNGTEFSGLNWVVKGTSYGPFFAINDVGQDDIISGPMSYKTMPIHGSLIAGDEWVISDSEAITGATKPSGSQGDMWRLTEALKSAGRSVTVTFANMKKLPPRTFNYGVTDDDGYTYSVGAPNLVAVKAPEATEVGDDAFWRCYGLRSVWLPNVEIIGEDSFSETAIYEANFPKLTSIGDNAFRSCESLKVLRFPVLKELTGGEFIDIAIEHVSDVEFPVLEKISGYSFSYSPALKSVSLSNVTYIEKSAFKESSNLESVDFPSLKEIENGGDYDSGAFYGCDNLTAINMPKVEKIGSFTFAYCAKLEEANLPELTYLSRAAFLRCTNLKSIYMPKLTYAGSSNFLECSSLVEVSLPLLSILEAETFDGCDSMVSGYFPSVNEINPRVFSGCLYLSELTISTAVNFIGASATAFEGVDTKNITLTTNGTGVHAEVKGNMWHLYFENSPPPVEFKQIVVKSEVL